MSLLKIIYLEGRAHAQPDFPARFIDLYGIRIERIDIGLVHVVGIGAVKNVGDAGGQRKVFSPS